MSKLAKGLTNKEIKENLQKISEVMNDYDTFEIENGDAWTYKFNLKKNKDIECRIMDEDWTDYVITISSNNVTGVKDIIKSCINFIYENEINWRQSCLKSNKGYFSRKHKSLNLWLLERNNEAKALEISKEIAERYANSKLLERDVAHFKIFVSRCYYALNVLAPDYKLEDVKEAAFKRLNELNIKNVGITHLDNKLIVMKSNEDSTYIIDKFDIEIDSYTNISATVNQIVSRLGKVA